MPCFAHTERDHIDCTHTCITVCITFGVTQLPGTNHRLFPLRCPIHWLYLTTDLSIRNARRRHWSWLSTWGGWHTYVKRLAVLWANHSALLAFPHFLHANSRRLANRSVRWEEFECRSGCELERSRAPVWETREQSPAMCVKLTLWLDWNFRNMFNLAGQDGDLLWDIQPVRKRRLFKLSGKIHSCCLEDSAVEEL